MSLIYYVPGTGDTDEIIQGKSRWWHLQSSFNTEMGNCIKNFDSLKVSGAYWSGLNSDRERFNTADFISKELKRISADLDDSEKIHIISHSHGGNIVSQALQKLSAESLLGKGESKNSSREATYALNKIASWTTVGTPFFHYRLAWHLQDFSKQISKALPSFFLVILIFSLMAIGCILGYRLFDFIWSFLKVSDVYDPLSFFSELNFSSENERGNDEVSLWSRLGGIAYFIFFIGITIWLSFRSWIKKSKYYKGLRSDNAESKFYTECYNKWLNIFTEQDEAIISLTGVKDSNIKGSYLGRQTFENFSMMAALFSAFFVMTFTMLAALVALNLLKENFAIDIASFLPSRQYLKSIITMVFIFLGMGFIYLLFQITLRISSIFQGIYSNWIGNLVDNFVWKRVRARILGLDRDEEKVVSVHTFPQGFERSTWRPLPDNVVESISTVANDQAGETLRRLRKKIAGSLNFADPSDIFEIFNSDLSFREFIHTSYFRSHEVIRLIAYHMWYTDQENIELSEDMSNEKNQKQITDILENIRHDYNGLPTQHRTGN